MLVTIAVLAFLFTDIAAVLTALVWLSEHRAEQERRPKRQPDRRY
jgi:hypothetical protein